MSSSLLTAIGQLRLLDSDAQTLSSVGFYTFASRAAHA